MSLSKDERFKILLDRLEALPAAASLTEALDQISNVLNEVENEFTSIPFNPAAWKSDGRMYPPQVDSLRHTSSPNVKRFRTRAHHVFISVDGAIRIVAVRNRESVFSKYGANGAFISEAMI